jgi:hypothetical protein
LNPFILELFRTDYNRRFGRRTKDQTSGWRKRPVSAELDRICAFSVARLIRNDHTVNYDGQTIDLPARHQGTASLAGQKADVRHLLDGTVQLYANDRIIASVAMISPTIAPAKRKYVNKNKATQPPKKLLTFAQIKHKYRVTYCLGHYTAGRPHQSCDSRRGRATEAGRCPRPLRFSQGGHALGSTAIMQHVYRNM